MGLFRRDPGSRGERAARKFLKRLGWRILDVNYKCAAGELDLVADDGDAIVFVEVKTRTSDADADPEVNVDRQKCRKLERVAAYWLAAKGRPDRAYRFDVLAIVIRDGSKPVVRHIEEAFIPVDFTG
ncbi:MAG: YraN family protein [Phycisphaerales bacterium]|nr:YraN family protein [Phycisphaerales bacterium]MCB9854055.1 YraN family protein [Phycisphaerales bacterium]MCB9864365.1 YraN family protein [Phycisphaerales bacterium]